MRNVFSALWADERGFLVSSELIIISTILVLGLIVGMSTLQNALVLEFQDLAFAFSSLNQSFGVVGYRGCKGSFSAGSFFLSAANRFCGTSNNGFGHGYGYGAAGAADFGYGYGANYGYGGMAVPGPAVVGPAPCGDGVDCPAEPCNVPGGCNTCPDGNCTPDAAPNGTQLQPVPMNPPGPQSEPKPAP